MLIAYLERTRPERNGRRFYAVYFANTLLGPAVVRVHGRKGAWRACSRPCAFPTRRPRGRTSNALSGGGCGGGTGRVGCGPTS